MLHHLVVENLALVDRIELSFGAGLNVLTGETGAGKSVLVNALSLVLGGRAQVDAIRVGADEGVVEAMFAVSEASPLRERLEARGIDVREGELVVRRVVSRSGKSQVRMNGQLATVAMLGELLHGVVDVTSQHEHVSLLDSRAHLEILDAFGGLFPLRAKVREAWEAMNVHRQALSALDTDLAERMRREDYLRFALDEIANVNPMPGELEALEAEHLRLRNANELLAGLHRAEGLLYSDDGAMVEGIGRIAKELERLSHFDDRLRSLLASTASISAELDELAREISRHRSGLRFDADRALEVEERLEHLRRLVRKHGGTIDAVFSARDSMTRDLEAIEDNDARRTDLEAALEAERARLLELARTLSASRQETVKAIERTIATELEQLSMKGTKFRVLLEPLAECGAQGQETVEFQIAPNVGEALRPIRKIASGGELSRILLAVKHALANRSALDTLVFDEIDTGIGGATADVLGAKLADVAKGAQVICVTHLPQVAAHGDSHFLVEKLEAEGRRVTTVRPLDDTDRIEELARMLSGARVTDRSRSLAHELRRTASERRSPRPPDRDDAMAVGPPSRRRKNGAVATAP